MGTPGWCRNNRCCLSWLHSSRCTTGTGSCCSCIYWCYDCWNRRRRSSRALSSQTVFRRY
jgi:hypothetical protein